MATIFQKRPTTIETIRKTLIDLKPILHKEYHTKNIGIFGSVLRNEQNANSDIDILVEFEKPVSLFRYANMENFLSENLHMPVDLVMKDSLKPHLGKIILREVEYV